SSASSISGPARSLRLRSSARFHAILSSQMRGFSMEASLRWFFRTRRNVSCTTSSASLACRRTLNATRKRSVECWVARAEISDNVAADSHSLWPTLRLSVHVKICSLVAVLTSIKISSLNRTQLRYAALGNIFGVGKIESFLDYKYEGPSADRLAP